MAARGVVADLAFVAVVSLSVAVPLTGAVVTHTSSGTSETGDAGGTGTTSSGTSETGDTGGPAPESEPVEPARAEGTSEVGDTGGEGATSDARTPQRHRNNVMLTLAIAILALVLTGLIAFALGRRQPPPPPPGGPPDDEQGWPV